MCKIAIHDQNRGKNEASALLEEPKPEPCLEKSQPLQAWSTSALIRSIALHGKHPIVPTVPADIAPIVPAVKVACSAGTARLSLRT